jgi:sRNA-binding carbon storage regulator CsrA
MLVLGRNPGQGIVLRLPDGREIRVVLVQREQGLRFQIDAPRDVEILRDELVDGKGGARC